MTPDSLATVLLTTRLLSDGLQPLKASEYWRLVGDVAKPGELLGVSEGRLVDGFGLPVDLAARVVALLDRATAVAFAIDELDQKGIATLTSFDDAFPARLVERLGPRAPAVLHAVGNLVLLGEAGLGVVGSREVSAPGGEVAAAAARLAADEGVPVVSGGSPGVDQIAMNAVCEAGGAAIGYLAESLTRTIRDPELRRALHEGATVLATPYSPTAPYSAATATGRNKLIYAHARATFVVASEPEADTTLSGALEALEASYGRVAVWTGDGGGSGNATLLAQGAVGVSDVAQITDLLHE